MIPPTPFEQAFQQAYDDGYPWTGLSVEAEQDSYKLAQFDREGVAMFLLGDPVTRTMWRDLATSMLAANSHTHIERIFLALFVTRCQQAQTSHLVRAMGRVQKPIICYAEHALGASLEVMAACNLRFAAPHSRLGLATDGYPLWECYPDLTPEDTGRLRASMVSGTVAQEMGIVDAVLPDFEATLDVLMLGKE